MHSLRWVSLIAMSLVIMVVFLFLRNGRATLIPAKLKSAPEVVMRPIWFAPPSVNQRARSGPATMPPGPLDTVGMRNSVMEPEVVMRPMELLPWLVNQSAPSGPVTMPNGELILGSL